MSVEFGTVAFYEEMAKQLNNDPDWAEIGKKLTYSMVYEYDEPVDKQFFVVFEAGQVTEVREAAPGDIDAVDFVVSGPPEVWRGIFDQEINPTTALTTGKMRVKGKMTTLIRNMKAFNYVIDSMTKVEFV